MGAGGLGFDSRTGQIGHNVANAATFIRSCVAQALNRGDGPCHSFTRFGVYRQYNEDLTFTLIA